MMFRAPVGADTEKRGPKPMWQHYKRTFKGMQIMIALAAIAVYLFFGHRLAMAATFYAVMQIGALAGAAWAARLKMILAAARRDSGLLKPRR